MTVSLASEPMTARSILKFRLTMLIVAMILAVECLWLTASEALRSPFDSLPAAPDVFTGAAGEQRNAALSARIGIVRGQLWASAAFSHSELLGSPSSAGAGTAGSAAKAISDIDKAIAFAPHMGSVWLLRAYLAERLPSFKIDPAESLRMSYYTAPSDLSLLPLRSFVATRLPTLDADTQELAARDVRLLLLRQDTVTLSSDYRTATPAGRAFLQKTIGETAPAFANSLELGPQ